MANEELVMDEKQNNSAWLVRLGAPLAAASLILSVAGCSSADEKGYDISPIFPLSADKCAEYNGDESGEGFGTTCMVTKADCERAAADWRAAMAEGGVTDAIQFSCD